MYTRAIKHAYIRSHVDASDLSEVMISFALVMALGAKPCPQTCVLNAAESEQNYWYVDFESAGVSRASKLQGVEESSENPLTSYVAQSRAELHDSKLSMHGLS